MPWLEHNLWMVLTFQKWPNFSSGFSVFMLLIDENVDRLSHVIHEDRWCLIDNTCNILGLLYITSECILTEDINTRQDASKFVFHLLNDDQKCNWLGACKNLQYQTMKDRNFLSDICLFQKMKIQLNGWRFQDTVEILAESRVVLENIMKWKFQETLPAVGEALGQVCKLHRGLLWRRQCWSVTKVNLELICCPAYKILACISYKKVSKSMVTRHFDAENFILTVRCEWQMVYIRAPHSHHWHIVVLCNSCTKACILAKEICQLSVAS